MLRARGTIRLARALVTFGAILFASVLATGCPPVYWLGLLPLSAVAAWNERWLARLDRAMEGRDEAGRRTAIRAQGKHVPRRIELGAWLALFAATANLIARSWP